MPHLMIVVPMDHHGPHASPDHRGPHASPDSRRLPSRPAGPRPAAAASSSSSPPSPAPSPPKYPWSLMVPAPHLTVAGLAALTAHTSLYSHLHLPLAHTRRPAVAANAHSTGAVWMRTRTRRQMRMQAHTVGMHTRTHAHRGCTHGTHAQYACPVGWAHAHARAHAHAHMHEGHHTPTRACGSSYVLTCMRVIICH